MRTNMRLVYFAKYVKTEIIKKVLLNLMITFTFILQALAISKAVNAVFSASPMSQIIGMIAVAVAAIVMRGFLVQFNEGYSKKIALLIKEKIRRQLLSKLFLLGPGYQNQKRSGNLTSLITDGVESLEPFLVNYIPQVFVSLITACAVVIYIFTLNLTIGLIVLACVIFAALWPYLSIPLTKNAYVGYWVTYAHLNAQYIDALQGMNTLKAFHASGRKGSELEKDARAFAAESIRSTGISLISSCIMILCVALAAALTVIIGAHQVSFGTLFPGYLTIILFLVPEILRPIFELNNYWHNSYMAFSVSDRIFSALDEEIKVKEKECPLQEGHMEKPEIQFRNVSFAYEERSKDAVNAIDFTIHGGETIALVGKSGAGKSTIANLLLRFYDPSEGEIMIAGMNIKDFSLEYLRSQIAVVFQDTYLFYGTIGENIRMAKPSATMEEVKAVAKMAGAHDFIEAMDQGYDTLVGERGDTLSGGERQRISIARAILKNAPILLLDEATSSVDIHTEKTIQEALSQLVKGKTSIIIAHRLSTIKNADRIFVMDHGQIVETGTHGKLLEQNCYYTQLIEAQRRGEEGKNAS